jgi:hypothetical protein
MRYHRPPVVHCGMWHPRFANIVIEFFPPKYSAVSITPGSSKRWRIEGPAEIYFLNQLAWDLLQALGESFDSWNKYAH